MPESYRSERPYPGQGFTLRNAADANLLVIYRCMLCRRPAVRYLASDLLAFEDHPGGYADSPVFGVLEVRGHREHQGQISPALARRLRAPRDSASWAGAPHTDVADGEARRLSLRLGTSPAHRLKPMIPTKCFPIEGITSRVPCDAKRIVFGILSSRGKRT